MPPLSELPSDLPRKKFLKALERSGFVIDERGGNGSHCKVTWPRTGKCVTIPQNTDKHVLKYVLKELEEYSGIPWDEIRKYL